MSTLPLFSRTVGPLACGTRRNSRPGGLRTALLAALGIGAMAIAPASAQPAPARPAPSAQPQAVPAEPGMTTASYGDWVLRCQRLSGEGGARVCEVAQTVQVQGQSAPVAQVAVGHLPGQDGLRMTALLPANVIFPSSVRVSDAKDASPGLDLTWRRCVTGGCLADAAAPDAVLKPWRGADEAGRIAFKDAEGRDVVVPLSFRGLAPALDALAREKS